MPGMDIFSGDAFGMFELTQRLNDQPFVPTHLREMGLFSYSGIRTTEIAVEKQGNTFVLVPVTARGGPATKNTKDNRTLVRIPTVRLAVEDTIFADEVQNVREFGSTDMLRSLQTEVDRRAQRMSDSITATEELHRITALKGQVLDSDGSTVILDLLTTFGVAAQTEVDFAMAAGDNPTARSLTDNINAIVRTIEDELGGLPYSSIHCICSSQFFDDLISHPGFKETLLASPAAIRMQARTARRGQIVSFGGVDFEEYRGSVGAVKYVADDKAHFFPLGVPDLFVAHYAPAEYWDTVNTVGLPRYARMNPDGTDGDYKRTLRVQCHPVHIMTRPRAQVLAKRT